MVNYKYEVRFYWSTDLRAFEIVSAPSSLIAYAKAIDKLREAEWVTSPEFRVEIHYHGVDTSR